MLEINLGRQIEQSGKVRAKLRSLLQTKDTEKKVSIVKQDKNYVQRTLDLPINIELYHNLKPITKYIGVTKSFRDVVDYFKVPQQEIPAGFRIEYCLEQDGVLRVDLVRDISYDKNGQKRPTKFLFSVDTADPYEVEPIKNLVSNLTCNPGIIYDLFINNPKINIGGKFKTRDEVMRELGNILGPGADISVELNDPFGKSEQEILEEVEKFKEMLSPYRLVVKVPHTGPVNKDSVNELLNGDKKFQRKFNDGTTKDFLRGHNLALMLREHGYRINFTLMFEPYQTAMALQAKPYFINSFLRQRAFQSETMSKLLAFYKYSNEQKYLEELRTFLIDKDYLTPKDSDIELLAAKSMAENILKYRNFHNDEGNDGLDSVRHNLRMLRHLNLPDTRLIICSMEGEMMFPQIDKLLTEDEFKDMMHRLVITAVPEYLAKFTSTNLVISYQRRFMNAAQGEK